MDLLEIKRILEDALSVRVPLFDPNEDPRRKIDALEAHLLRSAWHRAQCEEALYWTVEAGKVLRDQWDGIQGHEQLLPRTPGQRHTKEQIERAKSEINPGLYQALDEHRRLVDHLRRQIVRLGGTDYEAVSRAYTLISGS